MADIRSKRNTFPKSEKLCSNKSIDRLFAKGKSFIAYPLRVVYYTDKDKEPETKDNGNNAILISVSKRKFKRAVKRNRVKRLIREAYRLNKHAIYSILENKGIQYIDIAFIYLKDELPTYPEIEKAIAKVINVLPEKLEEQKNEENII